jgi:hypothetical protein
VSSLSEQERSTPTKDARSSIGVACHSCSRLRSARWMERCLRTGRHSFPQPLAEIESLCDLGKDKKISSLINKGGCGMRSWQGAVRRGTIFVVFLGLCGFGAFAQNADGDEEQQRKRAQLIKEANCLRACQNTFHARFSRCGRVDDSSSCYVYGELYMIHCLQKCRAPWFCKGYGKTFQQCPENCLKDYAPTFQEKRWDKKRKRWIRLSKAQVQRQLARAQAGCKGVCSVFDRFCSMDIPRIREKKLNPLPR